MIRAVGEPAMPVDQDMLRSVTFIIGDGWDAARKQNVRKPIGTGFFVAIPDNKKSHSSWHTYIITAAHVVLGQARTDVRVRSRYSDGSRYSDDVRDLPVSDWVIHETADVAATPFTPIPNMRTEFLVLRRFGVTQRPLSRADLGEPVFFLGMLSGAPDMNRRAIPIVRSGTVAALYERIPSVDGREIEAHLIDCRSYNGFSGAPCFSHSRTWRFKHDRMTYSSPRTTVEPHDEDRLLGMLVAHYDEAEKTQGVPVIKLNIGIGVVLPVERIHELLGSEVFSSMRDAEDEAQESPREATLDSDAVSLAPLEFEEAVEGLLSVRREDTAKGTEADE